MDLLSDTLRRAFTLLLTLLFFSKRNNKPTADATIYSVKPKYVSDCEYRYFSIIKNLLNGQPYVIFPQVPLSQIILKNSDYQGELNRVIDFCIFTDDYKPLLCIEINDKTHHRPDRKERDAKVQAILNAAGLPLLTFWPKQGINSYDIENAVREYLNFE